MGLSSPTFKRALEIGGPSRSFAPGGGVPVYTNIEVLDDVDFAPATAWSAQQATLSAAGTPAESKGLAGRGRRAIRRRRRQ